jgi:hypothetical protein
MHESRTQAVSNADYKHDKVVESQPSRNNKEKKTGCTRNRKEKEANQ